MCWARLGDGAFAAISKGSVVTWGNCVRGGDSSGVQEQLRDVRLLAATAGAFAAVRKDHRVITWGGRDVGGLCPFERLCRSKKALEEL